MEEVITVPRDTPKWDLTVKLELKMENNDSNAEGDAPPIGYINTHPVMKSLCTSKRPMSHSLWSTGSFLRSNVQQAVVWTLHCQKAQGLSSVSSQRGMDSHGCGSNGKEGREGFLMVGRCQGNQWLKRLLLCKPLSLYLQSLISAETTAWVHLERVQFRQPPQGLLSEPAVLSGCVFLGWHKDEGMNFHPRVSSTSHHAGVPNRADAGPEAREAGSQQGPAARPALPASCHGGELGARPRHRETAPSRAQHLRPASETQRGERTGSRRRRKVATVLGCCRREEGGGVVQLLEEKGVWGRRHGLERRRPVRKRLNGVYLVGPVSKPRERRTVFGGTGGLRGADRTGGGLAPSCSVWHMGMSGAAKLPGELVKNNSGLAQWRSTFWEPASEERCLLLARTEIRKDLRSVRAKMTFQEFCPFLPHFCSRSCPSPPEGRCSSVAFLCHGKW